ncbi:MTH938/NDUFAF3 family protein [Afifella sp. H1R]|uniref:Mth938-like domain-containing protein n=1 Tax=Afifella sp. H1R TaxID=2908841 RepID=UPI001F3F0EA6|nr:MTH938/NDUFAF3 family protein [Afifella sp. H1R]MCF1503023.1 MTH938/NDUFAF3 family protein [Afifella sp. H1R]
MAAGEGRQAGPPEGGRFPGRAPVDAYGNGGFRFAGMSHRGSILMLPSAILGWGVTRPEEISLEALQPAIAEVSSIEVLLIGTGRNLVPLDPKVKSDLEAAGLWPEVMATGAASRTYNILLAEERAVAAALIAVDDPE